MDVSTMLAKVSDPMIAFRLTRLNEDAAAATTGIKACPTDVAMVKLYLAELGGIRREIAALSMVSAYSLNDYKTGPAVATALDAYYCGATADPALWAIAVRAIGALVDEATDLAVEHVKQEKEATVQAAQKTLQETRRTSQMERQAELEAAESMARTAKMQREAAEADVRRKQMIFEKRNFFWRATHNLSDVA
ncbi:MAG: hypothetical protein LBB38_03630 [Puniceicoccales bacterium]|nr:hypothetical protein [Puniceicoccales bacterium]